MDPDGSAEVRRLFLLAVAGSAALLASSSEAFSFSEISTVPYTTSNPGEYRLSRDLNYAGQSSAIVIAAADVILDLAGFTLDGTAGPSSLAYSVGETYPPSGGESVGIHLLMAPEATVSQNVVWNSRLVPHTWGMWINGFTYVVVSNNVLVRYQSGIAFAAPGAFGRTQSSRDSGKVYSSRTAAWRRLATS